jgi:hypothetical protein
MTQLLLSRNDKLEDLSKPDVVNWFEIYKLINLNVSLVDRCDVIKNPYDFKNDFPMPTDLSGFNKSYQQVCVDRAEQLIQHSRSIGKPIIILYSGGIDSTAVVISFILAAGNNRDNIFIALNTQSIRENPKFYYEHIRGKFRLIPSEQTLDLLDGKCVMVGGEFNDQLFGSDIYKKIIDEYGFDYLIQPYTEKNITSFFTSVGMTDNGAKVWFDLLDNQIKQTNLCEIKQVKDFIWWLNFCFKWQSVYCRIISRCTNPEIINREFLDTYYHQFFVTEDFQKWSMLNPDKKIVDSWTSYKITAKQFIFDYTRDQDYFANKTKRGSLSGIFRQRTVPDALDSNYQPIWTVNKDDFYVSNNSFK